MGSGNYRVDEFEAKQDRLSAKIERAKQIAKNKWDMLSHEERIMLFHEERDMKHANCFKCFEESVIDDYLRGGYDEDN